MGDLVLKKVAGVLSAGIRKADVLARFGGEEFVVILPNVTARGRSRVRGEAPGVRRRRRHPSRRTEKAGDGEHRRGALSRGRPGRRISSESRGRGALRSEAPRTKSGRGERALRYVRASSASPRTRARARSKRPTGGSPGSSIRTAATPATWPGSAKSRKPTRRSPTRRSGEATTADGVSRCPFPGPVDSKNRFPPFHEVTTRPRREAPAPLDIVLTEEEATRGGERGSRGRERRRLP